MNHNNKIHDHDTSEAMTIDSISLTTPTKRRALEVELSPGTESSLNESTITMEDNINNNNNNKAGPQPAPHTVDNMDTLDIAWRDILHLLASFCNYEPGFLPLTSVQSCINTVIEEDVHVDINRLRDNTHMPITLARTQFDKWTSTKLPDDLLTVPQLHIVLHFTDIMYTEFHMATEMRNFQDKMMILQYLHRDNPQVDEATTQALTDPYQAHTRTELQQLQEKVIALTHTLSRQPRPATSWIGRLPEANLHLCRPHSHRHPRH